MFLFKNSKRIRTQFFDVNLFFSYRRKEKEIK